MDSEERLVEYIFNTGFDDLTDQAIELGKTLVMTVLGTTIAGATSEGCEEMVNQVKEWGGKEEATILIHGGKVPAYNTVLANSFMARALTARAS